MMAECEPLPSIACRESCHSTASQHHSPFNELEKSGLRESIHRLSSYSPFMFVSKGFNETN
jgi:hypothetical protein